MVVHFVHPDSVDRTDIGVGGYVIFGGEHCDSGADLPGSAVTALKAAVFDKSGLQRM